MPVDQTLSNFSDLAFQSAFACYLVALFISLFYYGRVKSLIDDHRLAARAGSAHNDASTTTQVAVEAPTPEGLAKGEARANKLGGMVYALVLVGAMLHLATVVLRGLATQRFPLGNLYEYVLFISLGVMFLALVALHRKSWRVLWPWVLTPMLALLFYGGTELYAESAPVVPALQSYWLPVHVSTVSLGASIGIMSGVASLLHLLRMWQLPGKESGFFGALAKPLPDAAKLDSVAYKLAVVTLPTLGLGILLGAIWAESAWGRPWGWDPKETVAFISWILYAAYLHARATAGWRNTIAPWINIVALSSMIFNLFFINLVVSGLHSYAGLN